MRHLPQCARETVHAECLQEPHILSRVFAQQFWSEEVLSALLESVHLQGRPVLLSAREGDEDAAIPMRRMLTAG